ncbi:hypothetical protein PRUPE_8G059100 [Prunus persica]|uniref:Uncharacterized protein n=1 Tax=Prunus persica TaxID=3760 RepID=M5XU86_PRUPE|nr:hypothetical protein PRUPE_8G059100 [Prunus persica]
MVMGTRKKPKPVNRFLDPSYFIFNPLPKRKPADSHPPQIPCAHKKLRCTCWNQLMQISLPKQYLFVSGKGLIT